MPLNQVQPAKPFGSPAPKRGRLVCHFLGRVDIRIRAASGSGDGLRPQRSPLPSSVEQSIPDLLKNMDYQESFGVGRQAANKGLSELLESSILTRTENGRRYFIGPNWEAWTRPAQ